MSFDELGYLAVFIAAATPWLEVVVVIPAAIAAGLHPAPVAAIAFAGNLVTLVAVIVAGDRLAAWWARRRSGGGAASADATASRARRSERVQRLLERYGLPGLALVGPLVTGTHVAGAAAVALGVARGPVLVWMVGGLVLWTVIVTWAAVFFGLDALR